MKVTLGNTLMGILLIITLFIIYAIEVEGDFSAFNTKAGVKTIIYLVLPIVVMYIAPKLSKGRK